MAAKKIVGITANILLFEEGQMKGFTYNGVFQEYIEAFLLAGATPLLLPPLKHKEDIAKQLSRIDLLVISGGADVQPSLYGETPTPLLEKTSPQRDHYEMHMVKLAYEKKIPIFGICRGLQIINTAFGGTLYQDISLFSQEALLHRHENFSDEFLHHVEIVEGTLLHKIFREKVVLTNSYHHQGIKSLASDFQVNSYATDGFIEGIERLQDSLVLAVQWHPEMMAARDPTMLKLFKFLAEC